MAVSDPGENTRVFEAFANQGNVEGLLSCYYLSTVLDDGSRKIPGWTLSAPSFVPLRKAARSRM